MFTQYQVDLIRYLSGAAGGGLVLGGLCGCLVGAATRMLRSRRPAELVIGLILGGVPGGVGASTIALCVDALSIALFHAVLFRPGEKGTYGVPDWYSSVTLCIVLGIGAIASYLAALHGPRLEDRRRTAVQMVLWGLLGGILFAAAFVGAGFNGYFVVESNAGPRGCAILGFITGAVIVALWRFGVAELARHQKLPVTAKAWHSA